MKKIESIVKTIDKFNDWIGRISAYSVMLLMFVVVYEVVSRRLFNSPTVWGQEMTTFAYGLLIMMVLAYGLLKGSHVCVDLLSSRLTTKRQHILSIIMYIILFFPWITVMIPASVQFASISWQMKEMSWSQWGPPVYPIKTVIPISFILLWFQGLSTVLKSVLYLSSNKKGGAMNYD